MLVCWISWIKLLALLSAVSGFLPKPSKTLCLRPLSSTPEPKKWVRKEDLIGGGGGGSGGGGGRPSQGGTERVVNDWKSGQVFKGQQPRSRRNDPWWMREEEKTNPRVLPIYKPWWLDNIFVDDSWKVADLRKEAARRGMTGTSAMKKDELVQVLRESSEAYDLSNKAFKPPVFIKAKVEELPSCYPEVYEGGEREIELLRRNVFLNAVAPVGETKGK